MVDYFRGILRAIAERTPNRRIGLAHKKKRTTKSRNDLVLKKKEGSIFATLRREKTHYQQQHRV